MAQRTTFAKLQRERAKQAKADEKRRKREGKPEPVVVNREPQGPPKTMEEMIWEEVQREKAAAEAAKAAADGS